MTKNVIWLYPERDTAAMNAVGDAEYWGMYHKGAEAAGMKFLGGWSAEAVDVVLDPPDPPRVYLDRKPVDPAQDIFVTDLYLYPYAIQDAWSQLSVSWVLRQVGFYLPIAPELSILVNDKVASIVYAAERGLPVLRSSRLTTGRDWGRRDLTALTDGLEFPIAVRPCNWGGGWGFNVARDLNELAALVSLASAGETILVLQPFLDPATLLDYRVVCIDGEPGMSLVRKPAEGTFVANMTRGGASWLEPTPELLRAPARRIAADLDAPYLCVDFLVIGDRYWFSEMEADGSVTSHDRTEDEQTIAIVRERFLAFDRAHDRWLSRPRPAGG